MYLAHRQAGLAHVVLNGLGLAIRYRGKLHTLGVRCNSSSINSSNRTWMRLLSSSVSATATAAAATCCCCWVGRADASEGAERASMRLGTWGYEYQLGADQNCIDTLKAGFVMCLRCTKDV